MKPDWNSLKDSLASAPAMRLEGEFCRLVPHLDLGQRPDWLFTSGKANRYNLRDLECVYFADALETARAEYESMWLGTAAEKQPVTLFFAQVQLRRVLDLGNAGTLKVLGLNKKHLSGSWRLAQTPTLTQMLGNAVAETGLFSAIRYPSEAAKAVGKRGFNLVVFKDAVKTPDKLLILGPDAMPLQKWP